MTLTDFLLARIAEDEKAATDLRDEYPHEIGPDYLSADWDAVRVIAGYARVLAECEAKRRIVEGYQAVALRPKLDKYATVQGYVAALEGVLEDLALPYADHPDCREEWKF